MVGPEGQLEELPLLLLSLSRSSYSALPTWELKMFTLGISGAALQLIGDLQIRCARVTCTRTKVSAQLPEASLPPGWPVCRFGSLR